MRYRIAPDSERLCGFLEIMTRAPVRIDYHLEVAGDRFIVERGAFFKHQLRDGRWLHVVQKDDVVAALNASGGRATVLRSRVQLGPWQKIDL